MVVTQNRGTLIQTPNTIILVVGTPQQGTPNCGKTTNVCQFAVTQVVGVDDKVPTESRSIPREDVAEAPRQKPEFLI